MTCYLRVLMFCVFSFIAHTAIYSQPTDFSKVVIWGHKLHTHTHSYIHNAFYKAFKHLGYDTYWFSNEDNVDGFDFSNSLFITEGQIDEKIPLREDCFYVLHNCEQKKYADHNLLNRRIIIQVYTDDVLLRPNLIKVAPCTYYGFLDRIIYLTWATDLLPDEIEQNKVHVMNSKQTKSIAWVGTVGGGEFGNDTEINPYLQTGRRHGYSFILKKTVSDEMNQKIVQSSLLAPTIVGAWQKGKGYIPCRIFKNISYGQMGITNSQRVNEVFDGKLIYDPDPEALFSKSLAFLEEKDPQPILDLMDVVKENHTYLNRIELILTFIRQLEVN